MAKITLTDVSAGYALTTSINSNNTAIEAAIENTLSRDGTAPNTMQSALDMNSYNINNLPNATQNQQPVTLSQAASLAGVTNPLTRETVGAVFYPETSAETSAGVTPTNYYYEPGDVRRYGAVGDGATDDITAITNAVAVATQEGGGAVKLIDGGDHKIGSNLSITSNVTIYAEGRSKISGTGVISASGTAAGNTSDLSASAERGDKTVTVVDGTQFSQGNTVSILASDDEDDNGTKLAPAELNEIASISTNVLTMKYPLVHDYTTGFTNEPSVTVVDSLIQDVVIKNVDLDVRFDHEYIDGLTLDRVRFLNGNAFNGGAGLLTGPSRDVYLDIEVEDDAGAGSGANALAFLYNITDFNASVRTYGGFKDGIRLRGCADGVLRGRVEECNVRGIWLYKSNGVRLEEPYIVGSQASSDNIELLLFDFAEDSVAYSPTIKEPNKNGGANPAQPIEFRGASLNCSVLGGHVYLYGSIAVNVKATAGQRCRVTEVLFDVQNDTSSHLIVKIDSGTASLESSFELSDCYIVDNSGATADVILCRTDSATSFSGAAYGQVKILRNTFPRNQGSIVSIADAGTGNGFDRIVVKDNVSVADDTANGSVATITAAAATVDISGNRLSSIGTRDIIISATTNVYAEDNDTDEYNITNATIYRLNGMYVDSANAETPTAASYQRGAIVDFTDTGDATGDGIYLLKDDRSWIQLA